MSYCTSRRQRIVAEEKIGLCYWKREGHKPGPVWYKVPILPVREFPLWRFLIARFMGPTWGPSGADRTQVGPMLAPWTLLSVCTVFRQAYDGKPYTWDDGFYVGPGPCSWEDGFKTETGPCSMKVKFLVYFTRDVSTMGYFDWLFPKFVLNLRLNYISDAHIVGDSIICNHSTTRQNSLWSGYEGALIIDDLNSSRGGFVSKWHVFLSGAS